MSSQDNLSSFGAATTRVLDGADSVGRDIQSLEALAARVFGIEAFRDMQREAIQASLEDRDLFLVLPTGGGKSLCFQAPALVRPGLTLVISPLISLMKDQVDGLVQNGVPAGMLTSAQTAEDKREVYQQLQDGALKLLYVAPERLFVPGFLDGLLRGPGGIAAIAIDEAHCISQWGHDFRPEYQRLGSLRELVPGVPIQAFTATATEDVREDVVRALKLREIFNHDIRSRQPRDLMIAPSDPDEGHTRRGCHIHIKTRIADHNSIAGLNAQVPHRLQNHRRIGLARMIICHLLREENSIQPMRRDQLIHTAPRLARRHPE